MSSEKDACESPIRGGMKKKINENHHKGNKLQKKKLTTEALSDSETGPLDIYLGFQFHL
uniref:Uncharacterized protein n=1 Tax=Anguilla anguilla TaxID=7936 RepID=A0A0E9R593_ANGAN